MEHIVQFAISIDDQTIQKRIEDNAYNDIVDKLMLDAKNALPRTGCYARGDVDWRYLFGEQLTIFMQQHKEEIIEAAATKLCDSYRRTKAYKDKMNDATDKLRKQQKSNS